MNVKEVLTLRLKERCSERESLGRSEQEWVRDRLRKEVWELLERMMTTCVLVTSDTGGL